MFVVATRRASAERYTDKDLYEIADKLRAELMKVEKYRAELHCGRQPPTDLGRTLTQTGSRAGT
jgi:hypothetical protein